MAFWKGRIKTTMVGQSVQAYLCQLFSTLDILLMKHNRVHRGTKLKEIVCALKKKKIIIFIVLHMLAISKFSATYSQEISQV